MLPTLKWLSNLNTLTKGQSKYLLKRTVCFNKKASNAEQTDGWQTSTRFSRMVFPLLNTLSVPWIEHYSSFNSLIKHKMRCKYFLYFIGTQKITRIGFVFFFQNNKKSFFLRLTFTQVCTIRYYNLPIYIRSAWDLSHTNTRWEKVN